MSFMLFSLLALARIAEVFASSNACHHSLKASSAAFEIPSWQSWNYSCPGINDVITIQPSPGKGLGVFANRPLDPGTTIMSEAPVLSIIPPEFHNGVGYPLDDVDRLLRNAFRKLPKEQQAEVLALTAHVLPEEARYVGEDMVMPIFRSNAFETGNSIGLFPKVARINHSCRPNAAYIWNTRLGRRVVYAARKIEEGEEVFVSYIPLLYTNVQRQRRLDQYGFQCTCQACAAGLHDKLESNSRRTDIRELLSTLEKELSTPAPIRNKKLQRLKHDSLKLAELVEEEELYDYYAKSYQIVALTHARAEDWEPATLWAYKSYQLKQMADEKSAETLEMQTLTSQLIENWNAHLRNRSMQAHAAGEVGSGKSSWSSWSKWLQGGMSESK